MILQLLLRILNLCIKGEIPEEIKGVEIITALKELKGANKYTLNNFLFDLFPKSETRTQYILDVFKDYNGELTENNIKNHLLKKGFPGEDFIGEPDLKHIMNILRKSQNKVEKPRKELNIDLKELVKALLKLIQYQKCGDDVDFLQLYPKEEFNKLVNCVFEKQVTLYDIYTREELESEVLWNCEDRSSPEVIKEFLLNKRFPEEYITDEILNQLVQ